MPHPSTLTHEVVPNTYRVPYTMAGDKTLHEIILKVEPDAYPGISFLSRWMREAMGCEVVVGIPVPVMAFPVRLKDLP